MLEIVLFAATVSLPLIIAAIPFKWPPVDETTKKLTAAGYVVIALVVIAIGAAVWLGSETGRDMQHLQSSVDDLNHKYDAHAHSDSSIGVGFDPKTGKSNVIDTNLLKSLLSQPRKEAPVEEKPEIVLASSIPSVTFYFSGDSIWTFVLVVQTKDKFSASNLKGRCILVEENHGGMYTGKGKVKNMINPISRLTNSPVTFKWSGLISKEAASYLSSDTTFIYVRIDFTNDDGKPQKPFERMYFADKNVLNSQLSDVTLDQYEKAMKFLVSKHRL